eukprot:GHVU01162945.1.p3 GENE.GHVU01162945.1~~GHVU01162945.1.p3  ORF type:complete len:106 (+),score=3.80 GHVU01162945.1:515-832(+)
MRCASFTYEFTFIITAAASPPPGRGQSVSVADRHTLFTGHRAGPLRPALLDAAARRPLPPRTPTPAWMSASSPHTHELEVRVGVCPQFTYATACASGRHAQGRSS